jgi:outer membrane lipoprotein-sorting protein
MDPFEKRLKSLSLRQPSPSFGEPGTLAAKLRRVERQRSLLERINNMSWTSKAAAIGGLAASVLVAYMALTSASGSSVAFAQVAEKLRAAQTLTFDSVTKRNADGKVLSKGRNFYVVPGKARIEYEGDNGERSYVVFDTPGSKVLMVDENHKTARVSSIKGGADKDLAAKEIEALRNLDERATQPLGEKQIEGVQVKGFQIEGDRETTTVWASTASGDPILVEILHKDFPEGPASQIWSNIKLDEPLDPQLFVSDPPPGYAVTPFLPVDFNATSAHYVAEFFKIYAKHMDGEFPPQIEEAVPLLAKKLRTPETNQPPSDEMMQLAFNSAAMHAAMRKGIRGVDWQYYPGHKLGEADQIVFWSHDAKSGKYPAVFGDLRIESVDKEQLPPAPIEE